MAKNIVLCSDGTGNKDIKDRGTNVFKLYEAVDIQGHKNGTLPKQVAFYDDGVGTSRLPLAKAIGGAFGRGFSANVKKLYRELVNVYEPGDKLYLFGFSRGAYTVRALAGLIQYCGVLDINAARYKERDILTAQIDTCWEDFRKVAFKHSAAADRRGLTISAKEEAARKAATIIRRREYGAAKPDEKVDISFIGVWDTVGAIGVPFDEMKEWISRVFPIWFTDNTLGPEVARACHALSIDDERRTFYPELWNEQGGKDIRIKQVWFAGVHSNVGGGYPKQGMSLVTLDWMMTEAGQAGLRFIDEDLEFVHEHQDVHDKLYDSRSGLALYYRWAPRDIHRLCIEHKITVPRIHVSVFERIANGTSCYAPGNIPYTCTVDTGGSFTSWPDPHVPADIQTVITAHKTGHATSLLEEMRATIESGKWSYYTFVALTAVATLVLGWLLCCRCWLSLLWLALVFLLCGYGVSRWAAEVDMKLVGKYSRFWHEFRGHLRAKL